MALNETIVEDVANSNFKVVANATASGVAQAGSIAALNAASHQHALNLISAASITESVMQRAGIDISEATAEKKVSEADLARSVTEMGSAIAALQQIIKTALSTPPVTP
jgi:hypothetical protein